MTPNSSTDSATRDGPGLHGAIMNIPYPEGVEGIPTGPKLAYKSGHRDARHAAAELALEADTLLAASRAEVERLRADAERLDWLLANPNTVLEGGGNEWFILDADSEPTYFKTGRVAIDAAMDLDDNTKGAAE